MMRKSLRKNRETKALRLRVEALLKTETERRIFEIFVGSRSLPTYSFPVTKPTLVRVVNPNGQYSGASYFEFGEAAVIKSPGRLKVVALDEDLYEEALVRYYTSVDTYGAMAPSGTLFLISVSELREMRR